MHKNNFEFKMWRIAGHRNPVYVTGAFISVSNIVIACSKYKPHFQAIIRTSHSNESNAGCRRSSLDTGRRVTRSIPSQQHLSSVARWIALYDNSAHQLHVDVANEFADVRLHTSPIDQFGCRPIIRYMSKLDLDLIPTLWKKFYFVIDYDYVLRQRWKLSYNKSYYHQSVGPSAGYQ